MVKPRKYKPEKENDSLVTLQHKIERAFSSENTTIYGRIEEIKQIEKFIRSKEKILNIVGIPGTGKTSIVLDLCKNIPKFKYFNFYKNPNIKKEVLKIKYNVVVIDEFDKFYETQLSDCKFVIYHLTSNGAKLITLGNNLEFGATALVFKPYTSIEIEEIVKLKIEKEIGETIISNLDLKILCKKHSNGGDMRAVFKYILNHFDSNSGRVILETKNEEKNKTEDDVSIHHKIILELGDKKQSKIQSFKSYFAQCEEYGIPPLSRNVFYELYDTLCYK